MTVLVTGGTGMLGSAIVRRLLAEGYDVVAADVAPQTFFLRGRRVDEAEVRVVRLDVADAENVARVLRTHRVSSVIHLAAAVSSVCNRDPVGGTAANCQGTAILLEQCRRLDIARVIMASSCAVYGADPQRPPQGPSAGRSVAHRYEEGPPPFAPLSVVYGAGKAYLEALGLHYASAYGMEIAGMRCAFIASAGRPSRPPLGPVSGEIVDAPALGRPVRVETGESLVPYVYVEDVVTQFLTLLRADAALLARGPYFNTGATTTKVKDIAAAVREVIPDAVIELGDRADDLVLGNPKTYSDALFVDTFGVSRAYGVREGVRAQIDEAREWKGL